MEAFFTREEKRPAGNCPTMFIPADLDPTVPACQDWTTVEEVSLVALQIAAVAFVFGLIGSLVALAALACVALWGVGG